MRLMEHTWISTLNTLCCVRMLDHPIALPGVQIVSTCIISFVAGTDDGKPILFKELPREKMIHVWLAMVVQGRVAAIDLEFP